MSSITTYPQLAPWLDRWNQPVMSQLIKPLDPLQKDGFTDLMQYCDSLDNVQCNIRWFGDAWKWTFEYTIHTERGKKLDTLCYLVPKLVEPLICVPLWADQVEALPLKRLSKYVREGVRLAKFAVEVNWATWSPMSKSDSSLISDLLKRKLKFVLATRK